MKSVSEQKTEEGTSDEEEEEKPEVQVLPKVEKDDTIKNNQVEINAEENKNSD